MTALCPTCFYPIALNMPAPINGHSSSGPVLCRTCQCTFTVMVTITQPSPKTAEQLKALANQWRM